MGIIAVYLDKGRNNIMILKIFEASLTLMPDGFIFQ